MTVSRQLGVLMMVGAVYGLSLTVFGSLLAAAGHGTYLLLGIASAPLSFMGVIWSLVGPPLLWAVLCGLLVYSNKAPQRQIAVVVLVVHYGTILLVPLFSEYAEWKYIERVWRFNAAMMVAGVILYVFGQIAIWIYWLRQGQRQARSL